MSAAGERGHRLGDRHAYARRPSGRRESRSRATVRFVVGESGGGWLAERSEVGSRVRGGPEVGPRPARCVACRGDLGGPRGGDHERRTAAGQAGAETVTRSARVRMRVLAGASAIGVGVPRAAVCGGGLRLRLMECGSPGRRLVAVRRPMLRTGLNGRARPDSDEEGPDDGQRVESEAHGPFSYDPCRLSRTRSSHAERHPWSGANDQNANAVSVGARLRSPRDLPGPTPRSGPIRVPNRAR